MSIVAPPLCNPAIFNPACFETGTTTTTGSVLPEGDFVDYPVAQGDLVLQGVNYQGFATFTGDVQFQQSLLDSIGFSGQDGQVLTAQGDKVLWSFQGASAVPLGTILGYVGTALPVGQELLWAFCDGQNLTIEAYGDLYGVIGTTYNISTTPSGSFSLPNMLGKMPVGSASTNPLTGVVVDGGSSNTNYNATIYGGNQTMTANQIPEHTHYIGWSSANGNFLDGFNKTDNTTTGGGSDRVVSINESDLPNNTNVQEPFFSNPNQNQADILPPFIAINWIMRISNV